MTYQHHKHSKNYADYEPTSSDKSRLWWDSLPWWKKAGYCALAVLLPIIGSISDINF